VKNTENKTEENSNNSIESYYKQFDSTLKKEKVDSFKTSFDSIHRWKDTKHKKGF